MLGSLRFHNYRLWFIGALVASIGTWMQRVAQDWLVLTVLTDDSGIAVGITTALQSCIPVGLASLTMLTAANATLQMSTTPAMRGRVMSLYLIVFLGATPLGSPLVGWVAETFRAWWSIGVGSIASLVVAGAAAVWAIRSWDLQVRYRLRPRPHLQVRYRRVESERRAREQVAAELAQRQAADGVTTA